MPAVAGRHAPDSAAIRLQLDRLLASPHLRHSKRCQGMLKHVVEAYLEGRLDQVKERCIGFEVFQRGADYDTTQDSVVRTTAAEVRKRLAQYYLEPEHEQELRVILPPGSYSPEFRIPSAPARTRRISWWLAASAAAAATVAAIALGLALRPTAFDRFWMPLLEDRSEAVICIEQPLRIYRFAGDRINDLNEKMVGAPPAPPPPNEVRENTSVKLSELFPIGAQYFTYGDLMATARLSELLSRKGKPFQVLGDRSTNYRDLRGKPAILLGQFNNQWTLGLTNGLRYYLDKDLVSHRYEVRDRQNPGKILASVPQGQRPEEYAIISRIFDVATEKTVIAVSATTSLGTLAAGDFLTHAAYVQDALRSAPANWYRKNVQVAIKAPVVAGAPGPPKAIATYFW